MENNDFKFTVRIKVDFGDRVMIRDGLDIGGIVEEISIGRYGTIYRISYFFDGDHRSAWLHHHQFERVV